MNRELANSLRQAVKQLIQRYPTGIWLNDFSVAWSTVYGQSSSQLQTALLQAGYHDDIELVKSCSGFCQITYAPEAPQRAIVRYADPLPKVEQLARQLRAESCARYEHVSCGQIVSAICRHFNVPAFEWFCVPASTIPTLQQLIDIEAKVYNFASAFLEAR